MEKVSLSLSEVVAKLMMVSEPALQRWSASLAGAIDDELLSYFTQRVRIAMYRIGHGTVAKPSQAELLMDDEGVAPQVLLLDRKEYRLMKDELAKAFCKELDRIGFGGHERELAQHQIDLLIQVLEDSIAVNFMSALFNAAERLENEKSQVRRALSDVTEALERDRQRLAFDLHDGPAQALSSALLQADMLEDLIPSKEARDELESLKSILGQCLHELRTSIYALKPQSMSRKGLIAKIKGYAKQFSQRTGVKVDVLLEHKERELPEVIEINIFRIVQEALNNVAKHAHASRVVIRIAFTGAAVACSVEDDGVGFAANGRGARSKGLNGYGLISMRDRVGQFLGTFNVSSQPGIGTRVQFTIPL